LKSFEGVHEVTPPPPSPLSPLPVCTYDQNLKLEKDFLSIVFYITKSRKHKFKKALPWRRILQNFFVIFSLSFGENERRPLYESVSRFRVSIRVRLVHLEHEQLTVHLEAERRLKKLNNKLNNFFQLFFLVVLFLFFG
jgi:hypothetical protein